MYSTALYLSTVKKKSNIKIVLILIHYIQPLNKMTASTTKRNNQNLVLNVLFTEKMTKTAKLR